MKKIYQVFVSSTYEDLIEERQEVMKVLLKANCLPIGMELFSSEDEEQIKVIRKRINEADFYVIIVAGKYGSLYDGKSYTQNEYEYAISKKKKIIRLLCSDKYLEKMPMEKSELDPEKRRKLLELRSELKKNRMCASWDSKDGLGRELLQSVHSLIDGAKKGGWIQYSKENIEEIVINRVEVINEAYINLKESFSKVNEENDKLKRERYLYKMQFEKSSSEINVLEKLKLLEELDSQINVSNKLFSSRDDSEVKFNSRDIVESLHQMGLPTNASIDITEQCVNEIIISKISMGRISTNDVRRMIINIIYKLDKTKYSDEDISMWGELYTRKYGTPDSKIYIIFDEPENEKCDTPLTYKFIKNQLIKELIGNLLGDQAYSKLIDQGQKQNFDRIPEVVMNKVKMLDINRISYKALLLLSEELATQTPHPWIILGNNKSLRTYDFEMSLRHADNLISKNSQYNAFYAINECIHHSSSGFLSIYKEYLGCGTLSPFYRLYWLVDKAVNNKDAKYEDDGFSEKLFHDLDSNRLDIIELYSLLFELKRMLNDPLYSKYEYVNNEMLEPSLRLFVYFAKVFITYYPSVQISLEKFPGLLKRMETA